MAIVLSSLLVQSPGVFAASHREAPITALDQKADITDWFTFLSPEHPDRVIMILNVDPFLEPSNGPNYFPFDPNVLYQIKVDNDNDAYPNVVFNIRFKTEIRAPGLFTGFAGAGNGINAPANSPAPVFSDLPASMVDDLRKVPGSRIVAPEVWRICPPIEGRNLLAKAATRMLTQKGSDRFSAFAEKILIEGQQLPEHLHLKSGVFEQGLLPREKGGGRFLTMDDVGLIEINEYFARKPEMMLGRVEIGQGQYGLVPELIGTLDATILNEAISRLPGNVYQNRESLGPVVRTGLEQVPAVAVGEAHQGAAVGIGQGQGLFDIDMAAPVQGLARDLGMHRGGSGDGRFRHQPRAVVARVECHSPRGVVDCRSSADRLRFQRGA